MLDESDARSGVVNRSESTIPRHVGIPKAARQHTGDGHSFFRKLLANRDSSGKYPLSFACYRERFSIPGHPGVFIDRPRAVVFPPTAAVLRCNAHRKARSYVKAVDAVSTDAHGEKPRPESIH